METSIINGVKELFELSLQIPGAKFHHNSEVGCVSIYDIKESAYVYNFESYYNARPGSLEKSIKDCREYLDSLKFQYFDYDLIDDNKVSFSFGNEGILEYTVHINDIYDFIVEYGMNEYYISEDETRRTPVDQVLAENPDIYETYFNEIVLPKIKNENGK